MIFEYIRLTGMGDWGICFDFPLKGLASHDYQMVKSYITMLLSLRHGRWGEGLHEGKLRSYGSRSGWSRMQRYMDRA